MKVFLFADLHVNYRQLSNIKKYLEDNDEIKAVVFAGDLLNMGEPIGFVEEFNNVVKNSKLPLIWVPGNNDFGRAYYKLSSQYKSLEGRILGFGGRKFAGVGGSPASWSGQYAGENLIDKKSIAGTIFISHVPPPGVHNYQRHDLHFPAVENPKIQLNTKQIQNSDEKPPRSVPDFEFSALSLKRFSDAPLVHICGHIHYKWGCAALGQTKIIKLAPAETGFYAIMDLDTLGVEFKYFERSRL